MINPYRIHSTFCVRMLQDGHLQLQVHLHLLKIAVFLTLHTTSKIGSPPTSSASPPRLTGEAVQLQEEELTAANLERSPLFSPHNQSCPKGAAGGLRRLNGPPISAFTTVTTKQRVATPAIPHSAAAIAPILSSVTEKVSNPFAAKNELTQRSRALRIRCYRYHSASLYSHSEALWRIVE